MPRISQWLSITHVTWVSLKSASKILTILRPTSCRINLVCLQDLQSFYMLHVSLQKRNIKIRSLSCCSDPFSSHIRRNIFQFYRKSLLRVVAKSPVMKFPIQKGSTGGYPRSFAKATWNHLRHDWPFDWINPFLSGVFLWLTFQLVVYCHLVTWNCSTLFTWCDVIMIDDQYQLIRDKLIMCYFPGATFGIRRNKLNEFLIIESGWCS